MKDDDVVVVKTGKGSASSSAKDKPKPKPKSKPPAAPRASSSSSSSSSSQPKKRKNQEDDNDDEVTAYPFFPFQNLTFRCSFLCLGDVNNGLLPLRVLPLYFCVFVIFTCFLPLYRGGRR